MTKYERQEETIIVDGLDLGDMTDLGKYIELGDMGKVAPAKRQAARSACASRRGKYAYLAIDVCASVRGKGPTFKISSTRDTAKFLRTFIEPQVDLREVFGIVILDSSHHVIGFAVTQTGTLNSVAIDIALTFKPALLLPTDAIIIVHNHPGDDPRPSNADRDLTAHMIRVGRMLGIRVLDHIIVGRTKYFSFLDNRLIPRR